MKYLKSSLPILVWISILLVACSGQATPTYFVPAGQVNPGTSTTPTPLPSPPEPTPELISANPSPSPDCVSNLVFLEDITIPDGTQVNPQQKLDKRWLVENNGTCNWDRQFNLRLIAGTEMGAGTEMALYPARSGRQVEIQIQFTAPQEQGTYRSAWQATDPQGNFFGDPVFIEIIVNNP
jgi:hypothetical protein